MKMMMFSVWVILSHVAKLATLNQMSNCRNKVDRGIYCPIIRVEGGGIKPVPWDKYREENWHLANFPYFWANIEDFLHFC